MQPNEKFLQREEAVTKPADPVVLKKREAWANLGELTHNTELGLQAMAQAILLKIKLPTTISDIPEAEKMLKQVKQDLSALEMERKTVTGKLDAITARLMLPEKSLPSRIQDFSVAIIAIKKAEQEVQELKNKQAADLVKCKEFLTNHKNNTIAGFNTKIIAAVDSAYTYALGAGNITQEMLPVFIERAKTKFTAASFTIPVPKNTFQHVNEGQYAALSADILFSDPTVYVADYDNKLQFKFSDYEIALANKGKALELARIEKELADKKIQEETANANVAAQLSSVAVTPTVMPSTKPLKSAYEIDMADTVENAILIITAFISNISMTLTHLRVTKWDSLSVLQMKNALVKCKTVDENFAATGIIFKKIDKL
jgi:uncharacterized protein YhaN